MLMGFFCFRYVKDCFEPQLTEEETELPSKSDDDSVMNVQGVFELDFDILSFH